MKRLYSFAAASLMALLLIVNVVSASAESAPSSGLSITPRKNLNIHPGSSVTDKLNISNLSGDGTLTLTLRVIDFTFMNNTGTPKLMLAEDAPQTVWSLKPFMTVPKTVTVPPHSSKTVDYTVKIPKGQGAGSYYSAIVYSAGGENGGNVNLNASGVTLAFVSVPGIVNENMNLVKFGAYQSNESVADGDYTFINTNMPKQMAFTLKNEGNVAESPSGSIVYRRMFSSKETTIQNVNPAQSLALRGQSRLFVTCIQSEEQDVKLGGQVTKATKCKNPGLFPGRYTATLNIVYGQNGNLSKEISATTSFWYLPWWFIGAIVGGIVLIVYVVWRSKVKIDSVVKGKPYQKRSRRR